MKNWKRNLSIAFGIGVVALVVCILLYKPVRIFAPETFGLTCFDNKICVEDPSTYAEAIQLTNDTLEHLKMVQPQKMPNLKWHHINH